MNATEARRRLLRQLVGGISGGITGGLTAGLRTGLPAGLTAAGTAASAAAATDERLWPGRPHDFPGADPTRRLTFPRDFGAHPDFRTEWWYLTGWLDGRIGFQLTFFRVRTAQPDANPSRFATRQLLFAHAALMTPSRGHPLHAQRLARVGSAGAGARFSISDTDVALGDWSLIRQDGGGGGGNGGDGGGGGAETYRAQVSDPSFSLDLTLSPQGAAPWLQGKSGFSQKGPQPDQASHYYSRPQLAVRGRLKVSDGQAGSIADASPGGRSPAATTDWSDVSGHAWFDHEWSTSVLDPAAAGWDWTGINFDDGSALVAFRIRRRAQSAATASPLWDYAARWYPDGRHESLGSIRFEVLRRWQSPRTRASYPVSMRLLWRERNVTQRDVTQRELTLTPLFDDQELDAQASTGTVYWEGAVVATEGGRRVGAGYLELTGYVRPLRL